MGTSEGRYRISGYLWGLAVVTRVPLLAAAGKRASVKPGKLFKRLFRRKKQGDAATAADAESSHGFSFLRSSKCAHMPRDSIPPLHLLSLHKWPTLKPMLAINAHDIQAQMPISPSNAALSGSGRDTMDGSATTYTSFPWHRVNPIKLSSGNALTF